MKKIFILIFSCYVAFASNLEIPDADKGQLFYKYLVASHLNVTGAIFAKLHTKNEWDLIFSDDGKLFYKEFKIKENTFDENILSHLKAFSIKYAKDSDVSPNCDE